MPRCCSRQPPLNRGACQMMRQPPRRTAASLSICLRPCSPKLTLRKTTRASELLRLELCRVCVNCYSVERRFKPNPNAKSMMRMAASGQQVYIHHTERTLVSLRRAVADLSAMRLCRACHSGDQQDPRTASVEGPATVLPSRPPCGMSLLIISRGKVRYFSSAFCSLPKYGPSNAQLCDRDHV